MLKEKQEEIVKPSGNHFLTANNESWIKNVLQATC